MKLLHSSMQLVVIVFSMHALMHGNNYHILIINNYYNNYYSLLIFNYGDQSTNKLIIHIQVSK